MAWNHSKNFEGLRGGFGGPSIVQTIILFVDSLQIIIDNNNLFPEKKVLIMVNTRI
jgi:hypothetical protein